MKKILSVVAVFALLVAGAISAKAAVDLGNGYSLNGTGNIVFYGASYQPGADSAESTSLDGESYRFELYLNKAFDDGARAVLRLRSGDRQYAYGVGGLGDFRGSINDQNFGGNGGNDANGYNSLSIRELYYQQPLFEKLVYFKIGKMQPSTSGNDGGNSVGSFFTDDATVQNVNGTLGSYGVEVGVSPISILTISYSFLGQNVPTADGSEGDKYIIDQDSGNVIPNPDYNPNPYQPNGGLFSYAYHTFLVSAKPIEKGNYRLGFWYSDIKRATIVEAGEAAKDPDASNGVFLSVDQVVADNFQLFARFGIRLDKTYGTGKKGSVKNNYLDSYSYGEAGMDWQVGATIFGALWGRNADSFFVGIGQASVQSGYFKALNKDIAEPSAEMHIEANYSFSLAPGISLTPFFQYVSNIFGGYKQPISVADNDIVYDSAIAYGLRTQIKF